MSRNSALKVINHVVSGREGRDNSVKYVEILGLKTLFPLFMKTPKRNKKTGHTENVSNEKDARFRSFLRITRKQSSRLLEI